MHRVKLRITAIISVMAISIFLFPLSSQAASTFINPTLGYEITIPASWTPDYSKLPDIALYGVGETGRVVIEAIHLPDEEITPYTKDEYAAKAKSGLRGNFKDIIISNESWGISVNGYDTYRVDFESTLDASPINGVGVYIDGWTKLFIIYYDSPDGYQDNIAEVTDSIDSLKVDESLVDEQTSSKTENESVQLDFIDPLTNTYHNDKFLYTCINPTGAEPQEVSGPSLVVFSTGVGEAAIRYLDFYRGSRETPEELIGKMLPEILNDFSSNEITSEMRTSLNNGTDAYIVELDAVYNGDPWKGRFVAFRDEFDEPYMLSMLAPEEEFEKYGDEFTSTWKSFTFE